MNQESLKITKIIPVNSIKETKLEKINPAQKTLHNKQSKTTSQSFFNSLNSSPITRDFTDTKLDSEEKEFLKLEKELNVLSDKFATGEVSEITKQQEKNYKKYTELWQKFSEIFVNFGSSVFNQSVIADKLEKLQKSLEKTIVDTHVEDLSFLQTLERQSIFKQIKNEITKILGEFKNQGKDPAWLVGYLRNQETQIIELSEGEMSDLNDLSGIEATEIALTIDTENFLSLHDKALPIQLKETLLALDENKPAIIINSSSKSRSDVLFHEYIHYLQLEKGLSLMDTDQEPSEIGEALFTFNQAFLAQRNLFDENSIPLEAKGALLLTTLAELEVNQIMKENAGSIFSNKSQELNQYMYGSAWEKMLPYRTENGKKLFEAFKLTARANKLGIRMRDVFDILNRESNLDEEDQKETMEAIGFELNVEEIRKIYKEAFSLSSEDLKNYQLIFPLSLTRTVPKRNQSLSLEERRKEVKEKYQFLTS